MTKREIWGWHEDGRDNGYVGWKNSDANRLVQAWKNEFNLSKWWLIGSYARFYPCIKIVKQVLTCVIWWFGILEFQKKLSVKCRMDLIVKMDPQDLWWGTAFSTSYSMRWLLLGTAFWGKTKRQCATGVEHDNFQGFWQRTMYSLL